MAEADEHAVPEVPIRIVNTFSDAAGLVSEGTSRLSASVLSTLAAQIALTTEEARAFSTLQTHAQAQFSEALDNVKDVHAFNASLGEHVSALLPALHGLDELEASVAELESFALGLRSHTQALEASLQDIMRGVSDPTAMSSAASAGGNANVNAPAAPAPAAAAAAAAAAATAPAAPLQNRDAPANAIDGAS